MSTFQFKKGLKQSCKTFILELNKNRVNYITGAQIYLTVQSERMSNGYVIDINYIYIFLQKLVVIHSSVKYDRIEI